MLAMSNAETAHLIIKPQMVQNAAAIVLTRNRKYDHISPGSVNTALAPY